MFRVIAAAALSTVLLACQPETPSTYAAEAVQQPVAPEVVESDPVLAQRLDQRGETRFAEQLAGQQVMPLKRRIVLRRPPPGDRAKRQATAHVRGSVLRALHHIAPKLGGA